MWGCSKRETSVRVVKFADIESMGDCGVPRRERADRGDFERCAGGDFRAVPARPRVPELEDGVGDVLGDVPWLSSA